VTNHSLPCCVSRGRTYIYREREGDTCVYIFNVDSMYRFYIDSILFPKRFYIDAMYRFSLSPIYIYIYTYIKRCILLYIYIYPQPPSFARNHWGIVKWAKDSIDFLFLKIQLFKDSVDFLKDSVDFLLYCAYCPCSVYCVYCIHYSRKPKKTKKTKGPL